LLGADPDDRERRLRLGLGVLLGAIAAAGAIDLALDAPGPTSRLHVAFELAFVALCLVGIVVLWRGWRRERESLSRAREALAGHAADRDAWRARAERLLRGLGEEIDGQLGRWGLTPAERDTALLLLEGYGHKDAARVLAKSERTVRQQAIAVYRKSGLSGRAELAAFFLEDLLLPPASSGAETSAASRAPDERLAAPGAKR
jgi:DNA-binding CsgD family transcriptional regulator